MASAVIRLSKGQKFNFSKYIFDSLVPNVDSSSKFYMVETPLFEIILVARQPTEEGLVDKQIQVDDVVAAVVEENVAKDGRMIDDMDKDEGIELVKDAEDRIALKILKNRTISTQDQKSEEKPDQKAVLSE
nr:hypothetical protein [Tanacetum cinerariifolium]